MNELLSRRQVQELLGYKSYVGFWKFLQSNVSFPRPIKRSANKQSRVFFVKAEIDTWMSENLRIRTN